MSTALAEIRPAIEKMAPQFKAALPAHIPVERFVRTTLTAVQTNPDLMNADRRTLFAAATRAAQMGLLPDGREGAIVTFGGKCQFMPMLGGVLKLVRNSGELASIDAQIVYKADKFTYRPGIDLVPAHEPDWFGDRGEIVGVYAVAKMKDGAAYVEILSKKQVEQVRNVSRSKSSGPWVTWWDEMARKTAIRRLAKRLPLSTDLDGALAEDDDLFMPPEQPAATVSQAQQDAVDDTAGLAPAPKRPSRLQRVAEQAPPPVDDDGVIDMPSAEPPAPPHDDHDSPI
jgi:recombination protein RecT